MTPNVNERLEILRRIAERGISYGQHCEYTRVVDLFQHMLDELARLKKELQ